MKILQINTSSSSFTSEDFNADILRGWYAQVAYSLKKHLKKAEIECLAPEKELKKIQERSEKGIKFITFPSSFSLRHGMDISIPLIRYIKKEIKKAEEKSCRLVIHLHEYHSWQAYLILYSIRKSENVRIICQHHGARSPMKNLKKYPRLLLAFPLIASMQALENFLFKKPDMFYTLSDEEEAYLASISKKIRHRFNTMGIADEYFKDYNKRNLRKRLHLDLNKKYVLFLGRIKTTKGIKDLLDGIQGLDTELLVIGEGPDTKKYLDYTKKKNIMNVKFLGPVYGKEKLDYLAASDCLVLPSHTEGAPVVIMEALARNLPVIATNIGGIPKMIKNKKTGILIPPRSPQEISKAIQEILKWNPKSIRKYAERYRWKNIIKEYIKDYNF